MRTKPNRIRSAARKGVPWLLPSLIGFSVFSVIPFFASFAYAFRESAFSHAFVGLANLRALFSNVWFCRALKNTLLFAAISVPAMMLLSLCAAALLLRLSRRIAFVRCAFVLPVLLPSAVITALWNTSLPQLSEGYPFLSLLLIFLWKYSGLNVMLILSALTAVDRAMLDAAQIDGAGGVRQFFCILLPNTVPTLFFVLILSFVNALKVYRESYLLWGSHPPGEVYMLQNYLGNQFDRLNYQNIAAAALLFAVLIYAVTAAVFVLEQKWSASVW